MKRYYIYYFLFSCIMGATDYVLTKNIIFSVILGVIYFVFLAFYFERLRARYSQTISRTYEAINFINNFIISLSVNNSLNGALTNARNSAFPNLQQRIDSVEHLPVEDRIDYLYSYFNIELYGVFINIVKQYIYNGGDIIKISQLLLKDSRNLEDEMRNYEIVIKRKFGDFITSWGLTIVVLVTMTFSLKNLSTNPTNFDFYPVLILIFFLLMLLNFGLLVRKIFDDSFIAKGEQNVKQESAN